MPTPPFSIYHRPFGVEPTTKLMMPDGIFDTSLGEQLVGVYYTTQSFDPAAWGIDFDFDRIAFTFEVSAESGIVIPLHSTGITWPGPAYIPQQHLFSTAAIRPSQRVLRFFRADFSNALVGKHRIRFRMTVISVAPQPDMVEFPSWDIYQNVFVTTTSLDSETSTINIECPEGTLRLHFDSMYAFPYSYAGHDRARWQELCVKRVYDPIEQCLTNRKVIVHPPLLLPKELTAACIFHTPFHGAHGELPFSDFPWKLAIAIGIRRHLHRRNSVG